MKKKSEAPVPAQGPLVIVDLHDRVPGMSDEALTTLHTNAVRLAQSGNDRQRASAATLLPVIEAELETRRATKLANAPVRKKRVSAKAAAAAAAADADVAEADEPKPLS